MRTAETILAVIRERGKKGLPLERVYRLLFSPDLYLLSYGRIYRNHGAMTRGSTAETADGMSLVKIEALIDAVRHERHRWTPARRTYLPKPNGKKRPLGIPTWTDKLLQEVVRLILDAYYEPQFSVHSHGFRTNRGCHTALREVYRTWTGTTWLLEGDISACFDSLDHDVLLATLAEKIHDGRFLRLVANLLKAGYLEDWTFNATLSGTPQGGVVSPILSNIYLDRLDKWVATTLLPAYNRGTERKKNPTYRELSDQMRWRVQTGRREEARLLRRRLQQLPSRDPADAGYRRLRYVRYCDDFLLGFIGPRAEAEEIKQRLTEFLRDDLKLELSQAKTLVTHARTGAARFLGYDVNVLQDDHKLGKHRQRAINGVVGLRVPPAVVRAKCASCLQRGEPIHRMERVNDAVLSIVAQYQAEFRGFADYYRLAFNLHTLDRLHWVMEQSLTKTLARKLRLSVPKVIRLFKAVVQTDRGPRKVLQVVVERTGGKAPLVAQWGGVSLARDVKAVLDDQPRRVWNARSELEQRLLADECELCGSHIDVQVHHVRALKDLRREGRAERPEWVKVMAARHRKTLVVCRTCHQDIHAGRPTGTAEEAIANRRLTH